MSLYSNCRLKYDRKLWNCIDWSLKTTWPHKTPDYIAQNKLYRITQNDQKVATRVYNKFKTELAEREGEVCDFIAQYVGNTNGHIEKFDTLNIDIPARTIVSVLIYDTEFIDNTIIRGIVQDLEDDKIEDSTVIGITSENPYSFESAIYLGVLTNLIDFCSVDTLSKMSYLSRYWSEQIAQYPFQIPYQTLHLTKFSVNEYNPKSSMWHFTDLKFLCVHVWSYDLLAAKFPKFKQDTIQYLNSNIFHFDKPLPNLRALLIWGYDDRRPLDEDRIKDWKVQQEHQNQPIKFTVIRYLYMGHHFNDFIPPSRSILFEKCLVTGQLITDYLCNNDTLWIGISTNIHGGYIKPFCNDRPVSAAEINKHTPRKHLLLLYCYRWDILTHVLECGSPYDKNVSRLSILYQHEHIDHTIKDFLTCISDVKNCNKTKEIVMLCHYDGDLSHTKKQLEINEFFSRDGFIFSWIMDNFDKIKNNHNISKFVFGVIRTYTDNKTQQDYKSAHTFDLKKLKSVQDEPAQWCKWNHVLYWDDGPQPADDWEEEYEQFIHSIPMD